MKLKQLYMPLQPTAMQRADKIEYLEFSPENRLQDFIYCYWQLKTSEPLAEKINHLIVADGCVDIFFEQSNPQDSYVMGFCKQYTEFQLQHSFNYVGVRFFPTMFSQLFKINAKELSNRFEDLDIVIPGAADFIKNNFGPMLDAHQIKNLFDKYFLQVVSSTVFNWDNRFYESLQIILEKRGVIQVERELDTGISPRQLRRLFEFYIGDTAKVFSKVVRFQNILKAKASSQTRRHNKLFFDVGYYDQAHFIKDFKNFYGVTPAKAFSD